MEKYKLQKHDKSLFWKIFLPVLLESVINTLFGIADTAMLGHASNSAQAIASVGVNSAIINVSFNVPWAFCFGVTVCIAQAYGAKDYLKCKRATAQMLPILALIGVTVSSLMAIFAEQVVTFLGANDEIYADAVTYFRIIGYGQAFQIISCFVGSCYRGIGQNKLPMFIGISCGALNVLLNYCLINGHFGFPALRVAGAAWATTISKFIGMAASLLALFLADSTVKIRLRDIFKSGTDTIKSIMKLGSFSALEQLLIQGGYVLTTAITTVIPTAPYAAYQISLSAETMIWAVTNAFCAASTTLSGMAKGEGDLKKMKARVMFVWRVAVIFALVMGACYFFFGEGISSVYSEDADICHTSGILLKISWITLLAVATHQTLAGGMRGISHPKYPLISSGVSLWLFRVLVCFICVRLLGFGVISVVACTAADQVLRATLNMIFFKKCCKKEMP